MAKFILEFEFTSSRAYGESYTRRLEVDAKSAQGALALAKIEGFRAFGARFNDNCTDWRLAREKQ